MYPDCIGGAELFTLRLASELSIRGHQVHLIARKGSRFRSCTNRNLYCHAITKYKPLSFIQSFLELVIINPDVIVAVMLHSIPLAYLYSKIWRKPLIVRLSGGDVNVFYIPSGAISKGLLYLKVTLGTIANYAYFICLSEDMFKKLVALGINKERVTIIPNFVDECFFHVSGCRFSNVILFIGGLKYVKGVDVLIEAFHVLSKRLKNLQLRIVGDGGMREELTKRINFLNLGSHVKILGYVPYYSVKDQLSDASVFVLPSRSEGLPNVLLQAMAAGLPIVATRVGGIPSLIRDGENGLLVTADNPEELAETIEKLLMNHDLAERLGRNAHRKAEEYRVERIVKLYEELFEYIITKQHV
jgi:glycosyltransferase involved in cell wall biosynthesis